MRGILLFHLLILFITSTGQESGYSRDTSYIRSQIDVCSDLIFVNPDQAQIHIDSIFKVSARINYSYGYYRAHNYVAIRHFMKGDYRESIKEYQNAMKYVDPDKFNQKLRLYSNISVSYRLLNKPDSAFIYLKIVHQESSLQHKEVAYMQSVLDLGSYYLNKEDYVNAVEYYAETESHCLHSTDTVFLVKAYSSLAMFYKEVNDFDKSFQAYQKVIEIDEAYEPVNFLASNYSNLGELFRLNENFDTAIYYYRKGLSLALPHHQEVQKLTADINIGNAFLESDRIDSAYVYYLKAYQNELIKSKPLAETAVLINLGNYYLQKGFIEKSYSFLKEGYLKAQAFEMISYQRNALIKLSDLEYVRGDYQSSLEYHKLFHALSDSLKSEEAKQHLALVEYEKLLLQEKFDNDNLLQENEIQQKLITRQQAILLLVIVVVLSLTIFVFFILRNRKIIKQLNTNLQLSNDQLEAANLSLQWQKTEMKELLMSKDRFVSVLAHDLKNPFTGLIGMLEYMLEDWEDISDTEKKEGVKAVARSSSQTYEFLQSLLDWGKTQQGLIKIDITEFSVLELMEEVLVLYHLQYQQKGIKVRMDISDTIKAVTDRNLLAQILQNLFNNAIKYSHVDGTIIFSAMEIMGATHICIKDEGIGIPEDKIKDLFSVNGSFNRIGTSGEVSSGMGLVLCKEYTKLLQAEIKVSSVVDKGSEFCIIL